MSSIRALALVVSLVATLFVVVVPTANAAVEACTPNDEGYGVCAGVNSIGQACVEVGPNGGMRGPTYVYCSRPTGSDPTAVAKCVTPKGTETTVCAGIGADGPCIWASRPDWRFVPFCPLAPESSTASASADAAPVCYREGKPPGAYREACVEMTGGAVCVSYATNAFATRKCFNLGAESATVASAAVCTPMTLENTYACYSNGCAEVNHKFSTQPVTFCPGHLVSDPLEPFCAPLFLDGSELCYSENPTCVSGWIKMTRVGPFCLRATTVAAAAPPAIGPVGSCVPPGVESFGVCVFSGPCVFAGSAFDNVRVCPTAANQVCYEFSNGITGQMEGCDPVDAQVSYFNVCVPPGVESFGVCVSSDPCVFAGSAFDWVRTCPLRTGEEVCWKTTTSMGTEKRCIRDPIVLS